MADFYRGPDSLGSSGHGRMRIPGMGPSSPFPAHPLGQDGGIRGHLERQSDGVVLYKVIFDVHGYSPEDLRTSLVGDRTVQVAGRTNLEDPSTGKLTTMSFEEQFTLPDNVDAPQLRSVVSNSQLIVSAPMLPPQYPPDGAKSPRFQQPQLQHQQSQSQPSPKSTSPSTSHNFQSSVQQLKLAPHQSQPQPQGQLATIKRYNVYLLELDLGREFSASDLKISTQDGGSRLVVHGQRQIRGAGKTSFREFRDEFDLPSGLDLARMNARLRADGRVFVEARSERILSS